MSVFQPLNVLQISLVVATKSGSTLTPIPNESGMGGFGAADRVERDRDVAVLRLSR